MTCPRGWNGEGRSNPKPTCTLAHGRLRLLQIASRKLSPSTIVIRLQTARLLTSSPSSMCLLIAWMVVRHSDKVYTTSLTLCLGRKCAKMFTRLSLCGVILKYTTITNLFLLFHSNRALGELNKNRIITVKQPEFNKKFCFVQAHPVCCTNKHL